MAREWKVVQHDPWNDTDVDTNHFLNVIGGNLAAIAKRLEVIVDVLDKPRRHEWEVVEGATLDDLCSCGTTAACPLHTLAAPGTAD